MTNEDRLSEDLQYVRAALARGESGGNPAVIYYLWAVITLVGFALLDHSPQASGMYWTIAGPLGGLLSAWLGWRAARARGEASAALGRKQWAQWGAMLAAIFLLLPLTASGRIPEAEVPRLVLLLVAFSYFTGGAYLDRRLRWIGAAVAGCYLLTILLRQMPHLWTVTAVIVAASLVACGLVTAAAQRRAEQQAAGP